MDDQITGVYMKAIMMTCFVFLVIIFSGCATTGAPIEITGQNDSLSDNIIVTTLGYERPFVINPSDHFFRGYIDKKTNEKTYQLYAIINSRDWMFWDEIRVLMNGNIIKLPISRVGNNAQCSQYGCAHYEDLVVNLKREILDQWSVSNVPIVVRYTARRSSVIEEIQTSKAELMVFLNGMDSIKY